MMQQRRKEKVMSQEESDGDGNDEEKGIPDNLILVLE